MIVGGFAKSYVIGIIWVVCPNNSGRFGHYLVRLMLQPLAVESGLLRRWEGGLPSSHCGRT